MVFQTANGCKMKSHLLSLVLNSSYASSVCTNFCQDSDVPDPPKPAKDAPPNRGRPKEKAAGKLCFV